MSHVDLRQVHWCKYKVWQRHAAHVGATNLHCKQISTNFMYYIQNVTVLDVAVLENTNSLSNNLMITCVCIVHGVVSSCVPFTSSFKVGK